MHGVLAPACPDSLAGEAEARAWAEQVLRTEVGRQFASRLRARDRTAAAELVADALFAAGDVGLQGSSVDIRLAGSDLAGAVGQAQRWYSCSVGWRQQETVGIATPNPAPAAENRATFHSQGVTCAAGAVQQVFAGESWMLQHATSCILLGMRMQQAVFCGRNAPPFAQSVLPMLLCHLLSCPLADAKPLVDGIAALLGVQPGRAKMEDWLFPTIELLREMGALLACSCMAS